MEQEFLEGIRLFNAQRFFEAHEALEAVWLKATGDRKAFLHGLIQVAAAFHHYTRGNRAGLRSLLDKGCAKLEPFGAEFESVDTAALLHQLQPWRNHLEKPSLPPPPLPRIDLIIKPQRA